MPKMLQDNFEKGMIAWHPGGSDQNISKFASIIRTKFDFLQVFPVLFSCKDRLICLSYHLESHYRIDLRFLYIYYTRKHILCHPVGKY